MNKLYQSDAGALNSIAAEIHELNKRWWADLKQGPLQGRIAIESLKEDKIEVDGKYYWKLDRNVGEMLCLVHSEISEALEGHRKNLMDDKLPHRPMIEVELADAIIRILDLCAGLCLDIGGAVIEKCEYNAIRADHKIENRLKEGGKKY